MQSYVALAGFFAGFSAPLSLLWLPGKSGFHHALPILWTLLVGPSCFKRTEFSLLNPSGLGNTGVFRRCFAASTLPQICSEASGCSGPAVVPY